MKGLLFAIVGAIGYLFSNKFFTQDLEINYLVPDQKFHPLRKIV
ncbi:hypothetical protein [Metabacillus schmidteae]|nr:hypothetical protein [Metabacillus schmidteae]